MKVTEIVKLPDGRQITCNFTETEFAYIVNAGVSFLLTEGILVLNATDGSEDIGTPEALEQQDEAIQQSKESTKQ